MACLSDMAFKMPSLFPQMSLTAQHYLRAEYLFTPPARLGGAKGTVSCGSSPGSPWKRRFSSPLSSGLVVVSGRGEMLLMQWGFLSPDKTTEVNTQNKNPQFFKIGHMYKSKKKKKIWKRLSFLFTNTVETLCPGILLSKGNVTTTPSCCYFCYFWQQ